jgi:hypothetical protein
MREKTALRRRLEGHAGFPEFCPDCWGIHLHRFTQRCGIALKVRVVMAESVADVPLVRVRDLSGSYERQELDGHVFKNLVAHESLINIFGMASLASEINFFKLTLVRKIFITPDPLFWICNRAFLQFIAKTAACLYFP